MNLLNDKNTYIPTSCNNINKNIEIFNKSCVCVYIYIYIYIQTKFDTYALSHKLGLGVCNQPDKVKWVLILAESISHVLPH